MGKAARDAMTAKGLTLEATAATVHGLYTDLVADSPPLPAPANVRARIWAAAWLYLAAQGVRARRRRITGLTGGPR